MILLSVLIPAIPNRFEKAQRLFKKLSALSDGMEIEVLCLFDNKKRSVGLKRDALVQIAAGKYLTFVDDDDDVYDDYIGKIIEAINNFKDADVIVFNEHVRINGGNIFTVRFGIEYENQQCRQVDGKWIDITRKPFHSCVWRSEIAKSEHFPDASYGEDWHWCKRLIPKVKRQHRIDLVLSKYVFDRDVTEAEHVFPKD